MKPQPSARTSATVAPDDATRLRVLVIAELANPDWVSVPLVGWSHFQALARRVDAHLATQIRNRENILKTGLSPDQLTAIDTRRIERLTDKLLHLLRAGMVGTTATALSVLAYYEFERRLWRTFGARIRRGEFDVVHRLTPLSPTVPSIIAARCAKAGVPFVIGPLNGGLRWAPEFDHVRRSTREWLSYVREAYKLLPGQRDTLRHASAIICGSRDTREQIPAPYQQKTVYYPENAIDPSRFDRRVTGAAGNPVRVAFVGRLVPLKGCDMLIEAAAPLVRAGRLALDIIGDGPQMPDLRTLAERDGLGAGIFAGWVPHAELQHRLTQSDVFAFPSIHDFGGAVVLEAMALGLVPVVVAYGGPGELVSPATGVAIPMGSREEIVARLRGALETLVARPESIRAMGERARERVLTHFTWEAKAAQTLEVYRWARGERSKPDFGMPISD